MVARAALATVVLAVASCGGHVSRTPARAALATAEAYLHALAHGDGGRACRLLSPAAMRDGGYRSFAGCARAHSHLRPLGRFHVVRVEMDSPRRASAYIGDAAISDSGDDVLPVTRYGRRWLLDAD